MRRTLFLSLVAGVWLCLAAGLPGWMPTPSAVAADVAETITFEPAPLAGGSQLVGSWVEKDLRLSTPSQLAINDTSNGSYPDNGTAYLQCLFGESPLTVDTVDGQPFSLVAVDLAEFSTTYPIAKNITFVGTHVDGTTASVTFTTDGVIDGNGPEQDFQTFTFPDTFADLQKVTVATDRYSMDNLQVVVSSAAPTPTPTPTATPTPTPTPALLPAITSATTVSAQAGEPFAYQIVATHAPTSYSALALPAGLAVNTGTGLISGTPGTVGTFVAEIGATNATGSGYAYLTINVSVVPRPTPGPAPVIISAASATAGVDQPFSYLIAATNTPTSFSAAGLPTGLALDPASGLISGTVNVAGTFNVVLGASNANGTGNAVLALTVTVTLPTVTLDVLGDGTVTEGAGPAKVVFRRAGSTDLALTVRYRVKGTGRPGVDYKPLPGVLVIPAGATQAKLKIKPVDNGAADGTRTVKVQILPNTDGTYVLGDATTAKIKIFDND